MDVLKKAASANPLGLLFVGFAVSRAVKASSVKRYDATDLEST
jgi:hypothetical protein